MDRLEEDRVDLRQQLLLEARKRAERCVNDLILLNVANIRIYIPSYVCTVCNGNDMCS